MVCALLASIDDDILGAEMRMQSVVLLLVAASSLALAEQMVWKVVSPSGMVSATVYHDLRVCKKGLSHYRKDSVCIAVPKN